MPSTPPATTTSAAPVFGTIIAASITACCMVPQRRSNLVAGCLDRKVRRQRQLKGDAGRFAVAVALREDHVVHDRRIDLLVRSTSALRITAPSSPGRHQSQRPPELADRGADRFDDGGSGMGRLFPTWTGRPLTAPSGPSRQPNSPPPVGPLTVQACVARRMRRLISSGCEISDRWLESTSIVVALIRLAMKRSRSGLIVRSCVETA